MANSRIRTSYESTMVRDLVDDFDQNRLLIPPHQREYRWLIPQQQKLIYSLLNGFPIPSILMSKSTNGDLNIQDGRQRITTLSRFRNNLFPIEWPNPDQTRTYSELTHEERATFDHTGLIVCKISGASPQDLVISFDYLQGGVQLTPGERYHAQYASPLVSYVKTLLLTPGRGFHDRAIPIWGPRGDPVDVPEGYVSKDKKRKWLLDATALVLGLLYGPAHATKKYQPDLGFITKEISPEKKANVEKDLERIFEIYETVNARVPPTRPAKWLKTHWDHGNFTIYMAYSLSAWARETHAGKAEFDDVYEPNSLQDKPDKWEHIKNTWIKYMTEVRTAVNDNPSTNIKRMLERKIHANLSGARSWNNYRWADGYRRVFGLEMAMFQTRMINPSSESDEESDSSEE